MAFGINEITSPRYSFFAIHLEPQEVNDEDFGELCQFIALADIYNIKITLQFTPQ